MSASSDTPTVKQAEDGCVVTFPALAAYEGRRKGGPISLVMILDQAMVDHFTRSADR